MEGHTAFNGPLKYAILPIISTIRGIYDTDNTSFIRDGCVVFVKMKIIIRDIRFPIG